MRYVGTIVPMYVVNYPVRTLIVLYIHISGKHHQFGCTGISMLPQACEQYAGAGCPTYVYVHWPLSGLVHSSSNSNGCSSQQQVGSGGCASSTVPVFPTHATHYVLTYTIHIYLHISIEPTLESYPCTCWKTWNGGSYAYVVRIWST